MIRWLPKHTNWRNPHNIEVVHIYNNNNEAECPCHSHTKIHHILYIIYLPIFIPHTFNNSDFFLVKLEDWYDKYY